MKPTILLLSAIWLISLSGCTFSANDKIKYKIGAEIGYQAYMIYEMQYKERGYCNLPKVRLIADSLMIRNGIK